MSCSMAFRASFRRGQAKSPARRFVCVYLFFFFKLFVGLYCFVLFVLCFDFFFALFFFVLLLIRTYGPHSLLDI